MLTDFDETLGNNFFHCILLPKKFPVKLKKFPGEGTPYCISMYEFEIYHTYPILK